MLAADVQGWIQTAAAIITVALVLFAVRTLTIIHVIVNSRMTHKLEYIETLQKALFAGDVEIPPDPHEDV